MRRALIGLTLIAGLSATTSRADEIYSYADLVCDPNGAMALARFVIAWNDEPPVYAHLPAELDHGLSAQTGTGRRVCKLANGWEVKLRNGEDQAFAFGRGGGNPPSFFSLWVDGRKVISRRIWTAFSYDEERTPLAGLLVTPEQLTFCEGDERITCRAERLDLQGLPIDEIEYPRKPAPVPGSLVIEYGTENPLCRALWRRGPNEDGYLGSPESEPDLPLPWSDIEWIDTSKFESRYNPVEIRDPAAIFGVTGLDGSVLLDNSSDGFEPEDVDGDGVADVLLGRADDTGYFSGSFWVLAPQPTSIAEMLRRLYPDPKDNAEEKVIDAARQLGWSVYAGGSDGLYPDVSPRYVYLDMLRYKGATYFLAHPQNEDHDPTAVVIKPIPGGTFETVCVFQRVRLNY